MDVSMNIFLGIFLALLVVAPGFSLPLDSESQIDSQNQNIEKRPKYMDTRDLDVLEQFIWETLVKFAKDGRINPAFLARSEEEVEDASAQEDNLPLSKRRRHLSMCLRKSGRHFLPYPCYKSAA